MSRGQFFTAAGKVPQYLSTHSNGKGQEEHFYMIRIFFLIYAEQLGKRNAISFFLQSQISSKPIFVAVGF